MNNIIEFKDKNGEDITIGTDDNYNVLAFTSNGNQIANFSYCFIEGFENIPDTYELECMNVESRYQQRGIGTKMIELGQLVFENVTYPRFDANRHENHLSSEGWMLIQSCIRRGIIRSYYEDEDLDMY